jgi:peroxiredoxin
MLQEISAMSAYLKGAIFVLVAIIALLFWYDASEKDLPANQTPRTFQIIDEMEKSGVPDFSLSRLDGSLVKLSDYKGKIVIVNFWASWCNPCVEEFPSMMKLVEEMKGEVVVIAVSTDDNERDIDAFTKAFGLPKPGLEIVWDKDRSVMTKYGVDKIPESFLVGKDLKLIRKVLGIENWASANAIEYFQALTLTGKP